MRASGGAQGEALHSSALVEDKRSGGESSSAFAKRRKTVKVPMLFLFVVVVLQWVEPDA